MLKVRRAVHVIEARHELARLGVEREAQAHDQAERRAVPPRLDLRQVPDGDAGAFGDDDLRQAAPVPQLLDPRAEQAPYALVPFVVGHDANRTDGAAHQHLLRRVRRGTCPREDA